MTPESRFLSLAGHAVVTGTRACRESTEKHPCLCPAVRSNTGIPPWRIIRGLLNRGKSAVAISRSGNQPARADPGDIAALTWKERLSAAPMTTAIAGSGRRGGHPAERRLGDLSVLTWSQSMDLQTRRGTAESQQGKTEKSAFLFLRWNWRLSRRLGIGAAASSCARENTNHVIRATRHTGWCMMKSSMMLNLELIVGGVRRETTKSQDTGDIPPPHML